MPRPTRLETPRLRLSPTRVTQSGCSNEARYSPSSRPRRWRSASARSWRCFSWSTPSGSAPLPVEDAHELVEVRIHGGRGGWGLSDTAAEITLPLWEQIRTHQTLLTDVFAWGRASFLMGLGVDAVPVRGLYVSGETFPALRTVPAHGRLLAPADDRPGCEGAVVLSHAFWLSQFGGRSRRDWHVHHAAAAALLDRRCCATRLHGTRGRPHL